MAVKFKVINLSVNSIDPAVGRLLELVLSDEIFILDRGRNPEKAVTLEEITFVTDEITFMQLEALMQDNIRKVH